MADQSHGPSALAQAVEGGHRCLQGVAVQRAEPLVDEQRVQAHSAGPARDHFSQAQRERERGLELLPAGQRLGRSRLTGVGVEHLQRQPGARAVASERVGVLKLVAPRGHRPEPQVRGPDDVLQLSSQHEGLQLHVHGVRRIPAHAGRQPRHHLVAGGYRHELARGGLHLVRGTVHQLEDWSRRRQRLVGGREVALDPLRRFPGSGDVDRLVW